MNPYVPLPSALNAAIVPSDWSIARWAAASIIAVASFALLAYAVWYTEFEPLILIDLLFLWISVFILISVSTVRWGLRGFTISVLLSRLSGVASLFLSFAKAAILGYEVMPVPN